MRKLEKDELLDSDVFVGECRDGWFGGESVFLTD